MLRSTGRTRFLRPLVYRRSISGASIPFSTKIAALIAKTKPERIYVYAPTSLVKFGSWTLSAVFFIYGITFADWSLSSSFELYRQDKNQGDTKDLSIWKNPTLLFAGRMCGSVILSIIPLTLSAAALYMPSRIVTSINYLPHGFCQITRRAIISGRPIARTSAIKDVSRNQSTRIYTGNGFQGVEDKASFVFFLTDNSRPLRDRFYIVNRSGSFWGQDGRIFDALFGHESIKSLERQDFKSRDAGSKDDTSSLLGMIETEEKKIKLSGNSSNAKNIVLNSKKS